LPAALETALRTNGSQDLLVVMVQVQGWRTVLNDHRQTVGLV
jgi:hypothetical protein